MHRLCVKKAHSRHSRHSRHILLIGGCNSVSFATRNEAPVNINIRKASAATILDLVGPLKLGEAEESLRSQIQRLVDSGTTHVAVNLSGVTALDSSGIGALVRSFTTLKRAGDRKSTRLNSSHSQISYAVFCLKKKK